MRAFLVWVALLTPALVMADGTFVWRNERIDIREPEQKAIILFDEGLEDLVLEVRYEGAPESFGWIVPLPSRPRLRADEPRLFEDLSRATQEVRLPRSDKTLRLTQTLSAAIPEDVRVLERAEVGIYDAAVLEAKDGVALGRWLSGNGFRMPKTGEGILKEYAERGWLFVALRIVPARVDSATGKALASGTLQPIRFRFRTPEPIFPLRVTAASGTSTQVLLYVIARTPLVHRTCDRAQWTENPSGPRLNWFDFDPDTAFPGLREGAGYLTKLRARVGPNQMEDVEFRAYNPVEHLSSTDRRSRIEAIAHLGWMKPPGAASRLVQVLDTRADDDTIGLTALWALGQVGGPDAIAALEARAWKGSWLTRLEALESLSRLDPKRAFPSHVQVLSRSRSATGDPWLERYVVQASQDHLVAEGDASCIGPLRAIPISKDRSPPPASGDASQADQILAARAACGDQAARDTIVRRLRCSAGVTAEPALMGSMEDRGSINDFPSGFWPGVHMIHPRHVYGGWAELSLWHQLLEGRLAVHDDILRRAARARGMPDLGRTLLLGTVLRPEPRDISVLLENARRGLRSQSHVTLSAGGIKPKMMVRYNIPTCTAAYALGRHRAADALATLWRECPPDDDLKGEVAFAMCLAVQLGRDPAPVGAHTASLRPMLEQFVRSAWNRRAESPEFSAAVLASATEKHNPGSWDMRMIDVAYRVPGITGALASDPATLLGLIEDRTIAPWLRIYWAAHFPAFGEEMRAMLPRVRRSLDQLEGLASADEGLRRGIAGARLNLDIGDKVYRERVVPRRIRWN